MIMNRKEQIQKVILEVLSSEDHARFAGMSEHEFDQSEGGWRGLARQGTPEGFRNAYSAMRVRSRNWNDRLALAGQRVPKRSLLWHAGQMAAFAGDTRKAARIMGRKSVSDPDNPEWNNYVAGTRSFLRGDKLGLQRAAVNTLRQPKGSLNTGVIMRLLGGLRQGKSYADSY